MVASNAEIDPRTPVLIGVGQSVESVDDPDYQGLAPIDMAANAARLALEDTGVDAGAVAAAIDTVAAIRQFEQSVPGWAGPFGAPSNPPRSVAKRIGADPARAILEVVGGQGPQHLLTEIAGTIRAGGAELALLVGGEAISTARRLAKAERDPDWNEVVDGQLEDRGYGLRGLLSRYQIAHGFTDAAGQYAFFENARRAKFGMSREQYAQAMGELFAPFTQVAAANPLAAAPTVRTAEELVTVGEKNRLLVDPYPRLVVSRDTVNQGAAVLVASVATARRLGVPEAKWVFLRGHADLQEQGVLNRENLAETPASVLAVHHALQVAGTTLDDLRFLDLYSCFPIAVFTLCDGLGLTPDDPRGLTVTGGLPYFGGPGNNYSMHAIAETVCRVRAEPGSFGLVGANGGTLSKYSVGVYSTAPADWKGDDSAELQQRVDGWPQVEYVVEADGWATVESYTVNFQGREPSGVVIGRLEENGHRFLALTERGDDEALAALSAPEPIGTRMFVRSFGFGNRITTSPERMAELHPPPPAGFRDSYEHLLVRRDGHLLEVVINRPDSRNSLHPPANGELAEVFDAYFADPDLWVAILTGAGDKAFCAGNDLGYMAAGKPIWVPKTGFAGLTSRVDRTKPVIAAVNGSALGGGFEIALACDLVVADESAQFALTEVKVGLVAGAGGIARLPRMVSPKVATELILTGRRVGADEAKILGIVNRVTPAGTALEGARELAAEILEGSPTSVRISLQLMAESALIDDPAVAARPDSELLDDLLLSADAAEGVRAFAEKRRPQWKNY